MDRICQANKVLASRRGAPRHL